MGHQIIKQPNGKFGIFSSVVDDFVFINATEQDIVDFYVKKFTRETRISVAKDILTLEDGQMRKPAAWNKKTFGEALDWIEHVHGKQRREAREAEIDGS